MVTEGADDAKCKDLFREGDRQRETNMQADIRHRETDRQRETNMQQEIRHRETDRQI